MKKIFNILATVIIAIVVLSVTTLAAEYEHTHNWVMFSQGNNTFQVVCEECKTMVSVDTATPICNHEFICDGKTDGLCNSYCTKCNYSVQQPHQYDTYVTPTEHGKWCNVCYTIAEVESHEWVDEGIDENGHYIVCNECGYEKEHSVTTKIDEGGHHIYCNECKWISLHNSHQFHLTEWDENFHAQTCECGYLVLESHNDCKCDNTEEELEETVIYGILNDTFQKRDNHNSYYGVEVFVNGVEYEYRLTNSLGRKIDTVEKAMDCFCAFTLVDNEIINVEILVDIEITEDSYAEEFYDYEIIDIVDWGTDFTVYYRDDSVNVENYYTYNLCTGEMGALKKGEAVLYFEEEDMVYFVVIE